MTAGKDRSCAMRVCNGAYAPRTLEFSMKNDRLFMTGTLAVMLAFGLVLAGCDNGLTSDDGRDSALVAKWYLSQDDANAGTGPAAYEFKEDGSLLTYGDGGTVIWKTSGGKFYLGTKASGAYAADGATYKVEGAKLTISNAGVQSGFTNGEYYKKAK
jgi:hypothetical protein